WIGPEGDWSKDEIDLASISDYTFTGLGPRRLRAETAAIHAVGLVSALQQDSV
ncbi:MAG: 16S rRNA (uracil(1498)-N(3))-methyltransferase, partial [Candidatus Marinimicrobia bacterium]|nr:16S rRNA (uracil(1498)-N(3))-methyltransferase [Candidatus Neomarinimicrobiota bacterium]MBT5235528.1 16S rRNA (uracil(1498)-N(3))-methyltransferase [Candidatus Neomarinimicrobiota bacterium]MBT7091514.1 16S rRNA (uracil(1498)-N(3))-methyltransferase [Candidatus Neomarinimicrobiota bacterium]